MGYPFWKLKRRHQASHNPCSCNRYVNDPPNSAAHAISTFHFHDGVIPRSGEDPNLLTAWWQNGWVAIERRLHFWPTAELLHHQVAEMYYKVLPWFDPVANLIVHPRLRESAPIITEEVDPELWSCLSDVQTDPLLLRSVGRLEAQREEWYRMTHGVPNPRYQELPDRLLEDHMVLLDK